MRIKQFVADRDHALLSLDLETLHAFMRKYNIRIELDPDVFWPGIHKARTACRSLPREARLLSKAWLEERGMRSSDGGELDAADAA